MPYYLITPEPCMLSTGSSQQLRAVCQPFFSGGTVIVQVRAKSLGAAAYQDWLAYLDGVFTGLPVRFILNTAVNHAIALLRAFPQRCLGLQLTARQLVEHTHRPLPLHYGIGASCHSQRELQQAQQLGVDWVTWSLVRSTPSHPESTGQGWVALAQACRVTPVPVFALGGMKQCDLMRARACGAVGIAGIRTFFCHAPTTIA